MTAAAKPPKVLLEASIDSDLDQLIEQAAERRHLSKAAFITQMLREASMKVIARSEVT